MRYLIFLIRFYAWFKNHEGIKAFADQTMYWLLRATLKLASRLKKLNKKNSERARACQAELDSRIKFPVIEPDELPAIKTKINRYRLTKFIFVTADLFFNFFAAKAIITADGLMAFSGQFLLALAMTYGFILLFEELTGEALHLKPYKGEHREERNPGKLIMLTILAIAYEISVYYLCKIRGIEIDGTRGDTSISTFMMILGFISPILAGYYDYMKNLYISPFQNTNRIKKLNDLISACEHRIAVNKQRMEDHFKRYCQNFWAVLQEFKTYKENWNRKHGIPAETLTGHYSAGFESYLIEAIERYKREAIQQEVLIPALTIIPAKSDAQDIAIKKLFELQS